MTEAAANHGFGCACHPSMTYTPVSRRKLLAGAGALAAASALPMGAARAQGKPKVIDGPFTEAKEVIGGFWMIQVKSKAEALEWAKRAPMPDSEMIEIRQVQEFEDCPADVQEAAANEPAIREQLAKKAKKR